MAKVQTYLLILILPRVSLRKESKNRYGVPGFPDSDPDFLSHGAEAYGFRGEVWTCARVANVFEEEFGVTYHRGHVARLLKALDSVVPSLLR
jgi:transposase